VPWSVVARNLPEHASNTIHTDAGARAAGYPSALVAGVTTYAYLTHPLVAAWGLDWLSRGGGEVRFRSPVYAGDEVQCLPSPDDAGGWVVDGRCPARSDVALVRLSAVRDAGPSPPTRPGEPLPSRTVTLAGRWGADYGARAGDDLALYEREGVVHPAVWPAIANHVVASELVTGPWIHTRSIVRHHAPGPAGATVDLHATVVRRFERSGQRAVLDVAIELDGRPLATLEHEATVVLP
jgi:acyl dehydratase